MLKLWEGIIIKIIEAAKLVNGTVVGNGEITVKGMEAYDVAEEGDITFALDEAELELAGKSKASCVFTTLSVENYSKTILKVPDMKLAITILYNALLETEIPAKCFIHSRASIAESAILGKNVSIGFNVMVGDNVRIGDNTVIDANCVVGKNVTIGKGSRFYPNVTIYDNMVIGNKVRVHSGSVIGADGFGYMPVDGKIYKIPQLGKVEIEDDVEIGANVCIDKGMFVSTVIGAGTKIDNQVQIAHNTKLGKNVLIAAQGGIAGSTTVGDNTVIGGQVGITDHVNVGKNVKIGARTAVLSSVEDNKTVFGYPHREASDAKRLYALLSLLLKNSRKFRAFLRKLPDSQ